ncbi:MAG: 50S ribosomal protein L27 [Candidatus Portnoybacteria bacterium CG_4_8_14_3_um_filter_44_10]|uniref:Large ribosomal subunit protein bL27 n=5 Tax=Candidatus Portnoyibacteriota TaxID=1817913 RepID=A0A2H0KR08_9BACT|nr:MAG: 50S ribosomal protein L27 [Parcubacteria group bacterium CG2_30_44_18]PIQ74569.1 MAG: 50S ribosomal protein L27 [Candidatus Portnoybacteria bacterium CG11_big_fil_rev_8_21_14_0_20_44_10]PIS16304.1 MAG: 50S ribosomal protein L27 [Candidatus Portnoybacteria bacterium CG09_land_8_20_14_0_10_44_13]PIW75543.1 MAG: 50S ribosomal protein L27 [Candidatus Portnoybacteria bacterium CG_4_8_14_3_um_filter_44_10]PIZ69747.1 MAG: 50S ribosomal protein L27 [Candidatus Portnoybacteria bacterium CG_4_10_
MSKTKAAGTTRLGRDSRSQRLGVKLFAGQIAKPGAIIIRQRGSKFLAGKNVRRGNDDTLYAIRNGVVKFTHKAKVRFDGNKRLAKVANVVPGSR